jgi:hypothetical protein
MLNQVVSFVKKNDVSIVGLLGGVVGVSAICTIGIVPSMVIAGVITVVSNIETKSVSKDMSPDNFKFDIGQ